VRNETISEMKQPHQWREFLCLRVTGFHPGIRADS